MRVMRARLKIISPRVTSPSSVLSNPEIAFSVVDLPAPLAPSKATIAPCGTSRLKPRSTRMTSSYTTSMLRTASSGAGGAAAGVRAISGASVNVPPKPFRLARQVDGLDLLQLDGALFHQVVDVAVGRP